MQGNTKGATECLACHGAKGEGQEEPGYPRLAGLRQAYLEKQLHDFASGKRINSIMGIIAKSMSEQEIQAVAGYYSRLPIPARTDSTGADPSVLDEGMRLAQHGYPSPNVQACFHCHGAHASSQSNRGPELAGQYALYIERQLQDWRQGYRHNDPNGKMQGVATRLTHDQARAVSAYLASLQPPAH